MGRNELSPLVYKQVEEILDQAEQLSRREFLKRVRLAGLGSGIITSLVIALLLDFRETHVLPTDEERVRQLFNKIKTRGEVLEYVPGDFGIAEQYKDNPLPTNDQIRFGESPTAFTVVNPLILRTYIPATGDAGEILSLDFVFFNPVSGKLSFAPYTAVENNPSEQFEQALRTNLKLTKTIVENFQSNTASGPRLMCKVVNNSTIFEAGFIKN